MTTLPRTAISPSVSPSCGTSAFSSSSTRSSPDVISSTPWRALRSARSSVLSWPCSGRGSEMVMNGAVSVKPYMWVISQPRSPSTRSMVAAAGGAPAVITRMPLGACRAQLLGRVGDADEHGWRGAQHRRPLRGGQLEHPSRLDLAQAHVGAAHRGHGPNEGPAVGVEHGQGPQVAIGARHVDVDQCADHVHVGVAMRDHHALGPRGRTAGVVDGQQVVFVDFRALELRRRLGSSRS